VPQSGEILLQAEKWNEYIFISISPNNTDILTSLGNLMFSLKHTVEEISKLDENISQK
jgi:hypothetical protein